MAKKDELVVLNIRITRAQYGLLEKYSKKLATTHVRESKASIIRRLITTSNLTKLEDYE